MSEVTISRLEMASRHADFSTFLCCGVMFQGNIVPQKEFIQVQCCGDSAQIGIKSNTQKVDFVLRNQFHFKF